ncbi:hypothetical protein AUEXF2481DRAFT_536164 [Aureobasidium subglaciale EXF-2481]|uniref:Uncharacterized protein n=1 Tax=Aureobasidium subglaciale (strain EXF-2481) TaxID=1043005 RepID=A0A074XYH0_AURSE|nr:uncharacterized protein AUEXF2481DRAFT_536164 [Aureobasidium subglaciale EXF-2481]KEQ90598.1 hypothetical protein AUEXF2481DRAFT_536164 [Aureobasidium subglaciale EXF-2481]
MNKSLFLSLPREIRDIIYSYVLVGLGPSRHKTARCAPAFYIHDFCMRPSPATQKTKVPDVLAITARDHPILNTCRQLSDEGFDMFLSSNEFVQDIIVTSLTESACKFISSFIKGLGSKKHMVRRMGLAIEEPDGELLKKLLDWLIMLRNAERIKSGVLVLRVKLRRPTKSPPLFSPVGESWTITPKDEDLMTLNIVIGDERGSWRDFDKSMISDWEGRQRGTDRVLGACRASGMESVKDREIAWRNERRQWWEATRETMREKLEFWLKVMRDLQPKPKGFGACKDQIPRAQKPRGLLGEAA